MLGLVGVGNLGKELAKRMLAANKPLAAFDLNPAAVASLGPSVQAPESASALVYDVITQCHKRPTVVSIVPNDEALRAVALGPDGLLAGFRAAGADASDKRLLHVSCSTVSPHTSRELAELHAEAGVDFVAAPIFARPENMAAGQASFVLSGADSDCVDAAAETLGCAAPPERMFRYGSDPGAANVVKLCGNFMIAAAIESIAESLALAEANGVDREPVMAMLQQTIFDCAIYHGYGNRIAQRDHKAGGFALELGLKDVSLILDTAHKANAPMPFGSVLRDRFLAAKAGGHADLDWSALGLRASLESGKLAEVEAAVEKARSA